MSVNYFVNYVVNYVVREYSLNQLQLVHISHLTGVLHTDHL